MGYSDLGCHGGKDIPTPHLDPLSALTVFAMLSSKSPVGLTAAPYEQFDAKQDPELVQALQQIVWSVVAGPPLTGVK